HCGNSPHNPLRRRVPRHVESDAQGDPEHDEARSKGGFREMSDADLADQLEHRLTPELVCIDPAVCLAPLCARGETLAIATSVSSVLDSHPWSTQLSAGLGRPVVPD